MFTPSDVRSSASCVAAFREPQAVRDNPEYVEHEDLPAQVAALVAQETPDQLELLVMMVEMVLMEILVHL